MHRHALTGSDDESRGLNDDALALAVVLQILDARVEGREGYIDADRTAHRAVTSVVRDGSGDDHLMIGDVLICLGVEEFALGLGIVVPLALMWVDERAHVALRPADEAAVLRAVADVEHVLVICGETQHVLLIELRPIRILGEQCRCALGDLTALGEPAVHLRRLHRQAGLKLLGDARHQRRLCRIVPDSADGYHEQRHECAHENQLLFDTHTLSSLPKMRCIKRI